MGVWDTPFGRIAVLICFDIENTEIFQQVVELEPDLIFNPIYITPPHCSDRKLITSARINGMQEMAHKFEQLVRHHQFTLIRCDLSFGLASSQIITPTTISSPSASDCSFSYSIPKAHLPINATNDNTVLNINNANVEYERMKEVEEFERLWIWEAYERSVKITRAVVSAFIHYLLYEYTPSLPPLLILFFTSSTEGHDLWSTSLQSHGHLPHSPSLLPVCSLLLPSEGLVAYAGGSGELIDLQTLSISRSLLCDEVGTMIEAKEGGVWARGNKTLYHHDLRSSSPSLLYSSPSPLSHLLPLTAHHLLTATPSHLLLFDIRHIPSLPLPPVPSSSSTPLLTSLTSSSLFPLAEGGMNNCSRSLVAHIKRT